MRPTIAVWQRIKFTVSKTLNPIAKPITNRMTLFIHRMNMRAKRDIYEMQKVAKPLCVPLVWLH